MKAIVQSRYGSPTDVLVLRDVETPSIDDDAVLGPALSGRSRLREEDEHEGRRHSGAV